MDSFVHDRESGITTRVSVDGAGGQGNGHSSTPVISAGGEIVAFDSDASNLVPGDGNLCDMDGDPAADPCLDVFQHFLADEDSDGVWDPFDWTVDWDGDLIANPLESKCESNPLSAVSRPERIDSPGDEDGDGLVNELLAGQPGAYDCDGDGYTRSAEANVTTSDQDPCGRSGWPSDLASTIFQHAGPAGPGVVCGAGAAVGDFAGASAVQRALGPRAGECRRACDQRAGHRRAADGRERVSADVRRAAGVRADVSVCALGAGCRVVGFSRAVKLVAGRGQALPKIPGTVGRARSATSLTLVHASRGCRVPGFKT